ncbi:PREDICTED: lipid phosphate phosphatase epsilon 2, chloroplastic [Fragaria vesca subsp. vesca]|uniref:lipid phosphate phosphatase epsilon 2, chloroplastic n=1 Tax=Fragaria vesca subsp. vesca TaxID=101020 RepID=UPI0002C32337|nr:PREDICTED: lipid phosphate phosphatase epsilon 2, chloroplastic [Fragaria vesca subsp. vesca]
MTSSAAISILQPKLQFFPCRFCSLKSFKPKFPISKLAFSGGLDPTKAPSRRNRVMGSNNSIVELTNLLPFRNNGNEAVRVLQHGSEDSGLVSNRFESTLNRLSKWLVSGVFAVVILCRHDGEAMWAALGSVVNSILCIVLKKILNQERPVPSLRSEPGMPSSHSQSIFYIFMFAIFSIVEWLGINEISLITSALALAFGAYLSWLRISQRLHTMSQVVVGAAIGTVFSILWYWSWNAVVHEAFTSFLWVRIVVILGAAVFCAGFLLYVIRYWIRDDR